MKTNYIVEITAPMAQKGVPCLLSICAGNLRYGILKYLVNVLLKPTCFTLFSSVSIVDFEQINVSWRTIVRSRHSIQPLETLVLLTVFQNLSQFSRVQNLVDQN